jgi:hypothetical protein
MEEIFPVAVDLPTPDVVLQWLDQQHKKSQRLADQQKEKEQEARAVLRTAAENRRAAQKRAQEVWSLRQTRVNEK